MTSQGPHVAEFAERFCRHTKGRWAGDPLVFEEYQREFLDEAFKLDEKGQRVYTRVLFGLPRKAGKSTMAAAIALYMAAADGEPGAEVVIAAGSREQAAIVFDQARAFVESNPHLEELFDAQRFVIYGPANSTIKRVAADGKMQHGLNVSAAIIDELHSFQSPRQEELWNALTTGSGAREQPLIMAITTAGYDKNTVLGRLYDAGLRLDDVERRPGLTIARDEASGFLMWWYGLDRDEQAEDEEAWQLANPASWLTPKVLRAQADSPTVDELAFRRLHLNMWTKTRDAWLPAGLWESLKSDAELDPDLPVVLGVDVGLVHDSTAVAIAQLQDDGRIVVRARVWAARDDAVAHVIMPGGRVDLEVIETHIEHLAAQYQVREVVYDPRFFDRSAQTLSGLGLTVAPIDQSSRRMLEAYADFYLACRESRLAHDGDRVLSQHVESTMATMTEKGWKISRQRLQRIDAMVATAMAVWRAQLDLSTDYVMSWDEVDA